MKKNLLIALALMLLPIAIMAKSSSRPFFDSKSWSFNVAGDTEILKDAGLEPHMFEVDFTELRDKYKASDGKFSDAECRDIAAKMNEEQVGKKFIDRLTNNGSSERLLKELALANMQRVDYERGNAMMRAEAGQDVREIVMEDYLPVLTHNYIVLIKPEHDKPEHGKVAIFRVNVSKEQAFDIMANIGNESGYNKLQFDVSFVTCGKYNYKDFEDFHKILLKKVPDMMIRGVLTQRNPAKVSIGINDGLEKGDLVSIYSQRMDKNGTPYSKRISRARVCSAWESEAQINFEAGTAGNRKNGDVVVRTPDSHHRIGLKGTWMPHNWGCDVLYDWKIGFTRSGLIHHFLGNVGGVITDHPGDTFIAKGKEGEFKAPVFINGGLGYGVSKTFLGFFDCMTYVAAQCEVSWMINENFLDTNYDSKNTESLMAFSLRVPIGFRFSINLKYPKRFFVEGGYAFKFDFEGKGDKGQHAAISYIKDAMDIMGVKRDGLFLGAGFMF
ncbi:MAG: hypothetical protein ACI30R_07935 [Sodaliphilus sp.]